MSLQDGDIVSLQEMPIRSAADRLSPVNLSASENRSTNNLLQAGLAFIDDGSIPIEG